MTPRRPFKPVPFEDPRDRASRPLFTGSIARALDHVVGWFVGLDVVYTLVGGTIALVIGSARLVYWFAVHRYWPGLAILACIGVGVAFVWRVADTSARAVFVVVLAMLSLAAYPLLDRLLV